MKLKESHLRNAIRNILLSELFVSPRKKKASIVKRALDTVSTKGFYDDDPNDGFGEFDEVDDVTESDETPKE